MTALSYPLALPAAKFARIKFGGRTSVGLTESPFTFSQQAQSHQGQVWSADVTYPPLSRANAEDVVGFLLALNGREGSFLMGDPTGTLARGSWAGSSPVVAGAAQTGLTLQVRGLADLATGKRGDWLQLGSGSSTRLHKVTQDFTVGGSPTGYVTMNIWPRLRASPADADVVTIASAKGIWRLASNEMNWDVAIAQIYGVAFSAVEYLTA